MTMHIKAVIAALFISLAANAQNIEITRAKFHTGDNPAWKSTAFNDNNWQEISTTDSWNKQNIKLVRSYAWYRIKFIPRKKDVRLPNGKNQIGNNLCSEKTSEKVTETHFQKVLKRQKSANSTIQKVLIRQKDAQTTLFIKFYSKSFSNLLGIE